MAEETAASPANSRVSPSGPVGMLWFSGCFHISQNGTTRASVSLSISTGGPVRQRVSSVYSSSTLTSLRSLVDSSSPVIAVSTPS